MTTEEAYAQIGADYNEVLGRLGSREMVKRFSGKFLNDKSYENLTTAMENQDAAEAFRAAHTLKGICLNLGFSRLFTVSSDLTECLRGGSMDGAPVLYEKVKAEYENTIQAIQGID